MKNVTLAMDEKLVAAGRKYAADHGTTLNALLREQLEHVLGLPGADWVDRCIEEMDRAGGRSRGKAWKRDELYDV